jgi:hypothetical protein
MCVTCVDQWRGAAAWSQGMVRFGLRLVVWAFGSLLLSSCLGGQTGQPDVAACVDVWSASKARAAANAFVGTYEAALRWQEESLGSTATTPVALDDSLQLTIGSDGEPVTGHCSATLRVPVTVTFATTTSGVTESGEAELVLGAATVPLQGRLVFSGERVQLDVTLLEHSAGMTPQGGLDALDSELPGAAATLVEP